MNEVQQFVQNFADSTENLKEINDFFQSKFETIVNNVRTLFLSTKFLTGSLGRMELENY